MQDKKWPIKEISQDANHQIWAMWSFMGATVLVNYNYAILWPVILVCRLTQARLWIRGIMGMAGLTVTFTGSIGVSDIGYGGGVFVVSLKLKKAL